MSSTLRKYILPHAHPVKFVAELLGIAFGIYFLWYHNWVLALIISMSLFFISTLLLWDKPNDYLAETVSGKFMLVYATPLNFFLYNFSALPLIYGTWTHNIYYIILAVIIFLLPQFN